MNRDTLSEQSEREVVTDGYDCYVRVRPGVYARVNRRGQRNGAICSGFVPRPRWKPARLCVYDERTTLRCENCGYYDMRYAETGERSFCANQGKGWEQTGA